MNGYGRRTTGWCAVICALAICSIFAADVSAAPRSRAKPSRNRKLERLQTPVPVKKGVSQLDAEAGAAGGVASSAGLPGVSVYRNDINPATSFYRPGAGERMADDLRLANGPCDLVYYDLVVAGDSGNGGAPFDVSVELWTDDPCQPGAQPIAGTAATFTGVANNFFPQTLTFPDTQNPLPSPVAIPGTVWMAVTFSSDSGGWVFGEQAEIGFTADHWSEDDISGNCTLYRDGTPVNPSYAGFWTNVRCDVPPPTGACCDGQTCSEVIEADCIGGVWQGGFTTCSPSPCIAGACCSGSTLLTCSDGTEASCEAADGLFHPGDQCSQSPCQPNFPVYANNFDTGSRTTITDATIIGDDLDLGTAAPCDLVAFDVTVNSELIAANYDIRAELWTNDDSNTPLDPTDDIPLAPIAGAGVDFLDVPGSGTEKKLVAGPFNGIQLDSKIWLVLSSSSTDAGPVLAGLAEVGSSRDAYAVFNDPQNPGVWDPTFSFGGFDPTGCPIDPPCNPAASFRANVWCAGDPPPGACCDAQSGACTDNVAWGECNGRWAQGQTCDANPFDPPCGSSACCVTEPIVDCLDTTPSFCEQLGGASAIGSLCDDLNFECPRPLCLNATGDCSSVHPGLGCNDPFCCEAVCADNPFCCDVLDLDASWDQFCVDTTAICPAVEPCPAGTVTFIDPPDGIIDARQPYPPDDLSNRQGYQSFLVSAPAGADNLLCWTPCESSVETSSNMITSVVDMGGGMYSVNLLRSISSGGMTTISYEDDGGGVQTGTFTSHPANVTADGFADADDVLGIMDCVSGAVACDDLQCDVDRSGICAPADVLRVIDLLQGAGQFEVWLNTGLPQSCP